MKRPSRSVKVTARWALYLVIVLLGAFGAFQMMRSRNFMLFGKIVSRVETDEKVVALTFDDGPTDKTPEVLAALDRAGIKATFFLTGREIETEPDAAASIVAAGHQIGNHSYSHQRFVLKSLPFIRDEIERTDALIRQAGYEGEIFVRPPYGKKLVLLPWYLHRTGRTAVTWDVEPDSDPEVAEDSESIIAHVVENVQPGSIILMHVMYDSRAESLKAIEGIVSALREMGYEFKTVSELMEYGSGSR